jgi:xanthine dehydrogenase small subunit
MRGSAETMTVVRSGARREMLRAFDAAPAALPLAGGTDLMVAWNAGMLNGRTILDLSRLEPWRRIAVDGPLVSVGTLVTHAAVQRHAALRRHFPLLVDGSATVGGVQIQNRGTLGGNVANASPAGDTFPALAVYEAVVRVADLRGEREVPFLAFFAGPKRSTLRPGELVEAIDLTRPTRPPDRQMFRKVGTRAAQAISKVVAASVLWLDRAGRVEDVRFAVGSVAPTVRRLTAAESFLRGQALTPDVVAHAASLVPRDISPIDDIRSTADYRLLVASRLFAQFLSTGPDRRLV